MAFLEILSNISYTWCYYDGTPTAAATAMLMPVSLHSAMVTTTPSSAVAATEESLSPSSLEISCN